MQYIRNSMGIKEKTELENARIDVKQVDEISGGAFAELGGMAAESLDAICETAELSAGNMEAILELGAMVAALAERVATLEAALN